MNQAMMFDSQMDLQNTMDSFGTHSLHPVQCTLGPNAKQVSEVPTLLESAFEMEDLCTSPIAPHVGVRPTTWGVRVLQVDTKRDPQKVQAAMFEVFRHLPAGAPAASSTLVVAAVTVSTSWLLQKLHILDAFSCRVLERDRSTIEMGAETSSSSTPMLTVAKLASDQDCS
jgi:hypothetical protein